MIPSNSKHTTREPLPSEHAFTLSILPKVIGTN